MKGDAGDECHLWAEGDQGEWDKSRGMPLVTQSGSSHMTSS